MRNLVLLSNHGFKGEPFITLSLANKGEYAHWGEERSGVVAPLLVTRLVVLCCVLLFVLQIHLLWKDKQKTIYKQMEKRTVGKRHLWQK